MIAALLAAGLAVAGSTAPRGTADTASSPADPGSLPRAETRPAGGVDPQLLDAEGRVRVRLLLTEQDLLEAATANGVQRDLLASPAGRPYRASTGSGTRITAAEKAVARRAEARYEVAVDRLQPVAERTESNLSGVATIVRRRGGSVLESELIPAAVVARVPSDSLAALARDQRVLAIDPAPKQQEQSSIGWQAVGAPAWFAAGFTGGGGASDTVPADAGVQSEIPDPTHPAFTGVNVDNYAGFSPDDHGTHTASVLASQDVINRGVAYGVDRLVNGAEEYQLGFAAFGNPAPPDPAEVINVSFGSTAIDDNEDDFYDITTSFFGVSQALGASNSHLPGGPPTVGNIGRNTMSVGGFNDVGTVTSTDDVVLGISSRGPTPGGRKKPDLTAPGGAVVGADSDWDSPPSNPDYTGDTGTSFASPHVAGAMTLLEGAGITDAMAQRAILINSARDWNGLNTGLSGWTAPQTGWRPEVGWGALDLTAALSQRGNYQLGAVEEGEAAFYRATVPAGSKATLAFQMRGFFTGYPGPPFPVQQFKFTQSNLDLHQYDSTGAEIIPATSFDSPDTNIDAGPDALDPNDTVEQVRSPATPGSQAVTYKVQSASTIDGAEEEPFAITSAAPLTPLVSPTVRPVDVSSSRVEVRCDQPFTISAIARNDSPDLDAGGAELALDLPSGVELVSGSLSQSVSGGTLETSADSQGHSWTVRATGEGSKSISVVGSGGAFGTTFEDEANVVVSVDCTPPSTTIDSGPDGPTRESTPSFAFTAQGGGDSFECSFDGSAFAPCASPYRTAEASEGSHAFAVRALDRVGNADSSPAERRFVVDAEVLGASLSGTKQRFRKRSRSVTVKIALGEVGSAKVRGTAEVRGRMIELRAREVGFGGPGESSVRLTARKRDARALAAALRRRPITLEVDADFSDRVGNRESVHRQVKLR